MGDGRGEEGGEQGAGGVKGAGEDVRRGSLAVLGGVEQEAADGVVAVDGEVGVSIVEACVVDLVGGEAGVKSVGGEDAEVARGQVVGDDVEEVGEAVGGVGVEEMWKGEVGGGGRLAGGVMEGERAFKLGRADAARRGGGAVDVVGHRRLGRAGDARDERGQHPASVPCNGRLGWAHG